MRKLNNTLIIGIGNNTRQDDGLGWCFLDALEEKGVDPDQLLYKYQLMVEDAELIADYQAVIFVDASKEDFKNGFEMVPLMPAENVAFSTHEVPPNQILNLCQNIYGKLPKAMLIKITGYTWDIEISLSKSAQQNLKNALDNFEKEYL